MLKEREDFETYVTYETGRRTVASPRTTDECARRTTIKDTHGTTILFIDQRETKKEAKRLYIQNECQNIFERK